MISSSKHALIFSVLLLAASPLAAGGVIGEVRFDGAREIPAEELARNRHLVPGSVFSDSLLGLELARIDSLYFSRGLLAARVTVDTISTADSVEVRLTITEGESTTMNLVTTSGTGGLGADEAAEALGLRKGEAFYPHRLESALAGLLDHYNNAGFPYAQVWLTGFSYDGEANTVDLNVSIFEGDRAALSGVIFEGLTKTDTTLVMRTSHLRRGGTYREEDIERAVRFLEAAPFLESVGEPRVERRREGEIDVVIPVTEPQRNNALQGAVGFSRDAKGEYILSGALDLQLRNLGGTGRDVHFNWLNDGLGYSTLRLAYSKLYLFSLSVHFEADIRQVIQDTLYTFHSGGLYLRFPTVPGFTLLAGAAGDRNVPVSGSLQRSVRQRYRLGFDWMIGQYRRLAFYAEGAYKKNYFGGDSTDTMGQLLYDLEGSYRFPTFRKQSFFLRLVAEGVVSGGEILPAETYPLGGAGSLRGYRENQFRGEQIAYTNIEYWLGGEGRLFFFEDIGAFYNAGSGWTFKNGVGFGLRSPSPIGTVALSFAVGDRLSLEQTRIHVQLVEQF